MADTVGDFIVRRLARAVQIDKPTFSTSQDIPDVRYADFAESLGLAARRRPK